MRDAIAPVINDLNAPFWVGAARGDLVLPHGVETGRAFWPPSPWSPSGGGVEWKAVEPVGVVCANAVYRRVFLKAFEPLAPYGIALVALDCGVRLNAHVCDPDGRAAPRAGDRVQLGFRALVHGAHVMPVAEGLPVAEKGGRR